MGLDPGGAADRRRQFLLYEPDGALNPDSQLLMLMPQRLSQLVRGGHIPSPHPPWTAMAVGTTVRAPGQTATAQAAARVSPSARSSRPRRKSTSARVSADREALGLRWASEARTPRFLRTYLRTASPIPGCCS
jgi:hypothetical protein